MNAQENVKPVAPEQLHLAKQDPVNFLFARLQERKTGYCLDGDDKPCLEIKDDPTRQLHRLVDDQGRPTQRARSFLRSTFRYETGEQQHLDNAELLLLVDYLVEEAFKGGRTIVRTEPAKDGDYNFEAVVVFANGLRSPDDPVKGPGNKLLELVLDGEKDDRLKPKISQNAEQQTLIVELRTADLWRAVNSKEVEIHVHAEKKTLFSAINFFSRRLGELEQQFEKVGLDVALSHRDSGSWVRITRRDREFQPDPSILVTATDGHQPSSSGPSSGANPNAGKTLETTDDNTIEIEKPKTEKVA